MLPPFVPPSARIANENLPLITEFVIDRVEHSFGSLFSVSGATDAGGVATLPSIDEFVRAQPEVATSADDEEFVRRTSRSPWGTYEADHEGAGKPDAGRTGPVSIEPDLLLEHRNPSGSGDAIVNEIVEPAEAWEASAASSTIDATPAEPESSVAAPIPAAPEVWVAEERDAFDWQAAANLAVPPAEVQRAAEEWSSTEWGRSSGSIQDHVAALLAQVSRRVRSGELEIQGSKQMGTEAALVAALAALLSEQAGQ